MTNEEAFKSIFPNKEGSITNKKHNDRINPKWHIGRQEVGLLINRIYDDFESRICSNCKFWKEEGRQSHCNRKYSTTDCFIMDQYETIYTFRDFSCNKWEKKDDS
jgi:hypothetical protein